MFSPALENTKRAFACCDRALTLDPEHVLARQSRGGYPGAMCRYDEAAASLIRWTC